MVTPEMLNCCPVGAIPLRSPLWVPRQAGDGHAGYVELFPRWRNPAEITFMGTSAGPSGHHGFALGKEVLDRQLKVGESGAVERRSLPFTLRAQPKIERRRIMV